MQKCVEALYAFLQNVVLKNIYIWNCYTSEPILVKDKNLSADDAEI